MKVAVIICYHHTDYVRAQTLRAAVVASGHELVDIRNSRKGLYRYIEILYEVVRARIRHRPDVYILTFRGYEVLAAMNLLTWPKPFIFDEFINPLMWLQEPRAERWIKFVPKQFLAAMYRLLLRRPYAILSDTPVHAAFSARLTFGRKTPKITSLPVSTDESKFKPPVRRQNKMTGTKFKVFYYGSMVPLHGVQHVLDAAVALRHLPIEFVIIGGNTTTAAAVRDIQRQGAAVMYRNWVAYEELPQYIYDADLCLGGPFGDTTQAGLVITGKTYQFLACAAPVLIGQTAAAAHTELKHRVNCLTVPLGSSQAIAEEIKWAQSHPKQLREIAKHGRQLYERKFSIRAIAPQLEAILRMKPDDNQK